MSKKKNTAKVPDWVPKLHAAGYGISAEQARQLDLAAWEMTNDTTFDESAGTNLHQAELGRSTTHGSTYARVDGVTTSPKISKHDVPYDKLRNRFNDLESSDVEELLEYCYGKSVYEAAAESFATYDPAKLKEILSMSDVEVEDLLDGDADDEDDEEEDEADG